MLLVKFSRLFLLLLIFFLISCHSSGEQSFEQLEKALIDWYYKYKPTIATEHNISGYNNQLEKYDSNSIDEYQADINRFIIELSQIDETKLNNKNKLKYLIIEQFLLENYYHILHVKDFSYNPKPFINNLYKSIFYIIYNNNIEMEEKVFSISERLLSSVNTINNIQKNIIYYSKHDIDQALDVIYKFQELLNYLPLYVNADDQTLDGIDVNILNVKKAIYQLKNHFENLSKNLSIDKKEIVSNYLSFNNKNVNSSFNYMVLINQIHERMLNLSLPIYKEYNDEPVWVDKQDTLDIINFVLDNSLKLYPDKDKIVMSLDKSLNKINLFSKQILNFPKDINNNYEIIINDYTYLDSNMLYELWNDGIKTYLFLSKSHYDENDQKNKYNKFELDLYNMANFFPGKFFQKLKTQTKDGGINSIFINKNTNSAWGLLSQYIFIDKGYGELENDIYMLVHLKNVLNSILEKKFFEDYYIYNKSKFEIENEMHDMTIYKRENVEEIISHVINNPFNSNFEISSYLNLRELYDTSGEDFLDFYLFLIENGHLSVDLIRESKF